MNTPQYLLAKYIPDLRRGEPRNIGVIVWNGDAVEARFVGEKAGRPGEVDGRSVPVFVTSPAAYKQWIEYWRVQLSRDAIAPATGGPIARRDQIEYLRALKASGKGNFALVDGGFLLDRLDSDQLPDLAEHLFATLVDTMGSDEPRDPTLDEVITRLLSQAGLEHDRNFKNNVKVPCTLSNGKTETFKFDYAYENGSLRRLYERLPLPKRHTTQQIRVDATAWKFEQVNRSGLLREDKPVAIVYPTDEQRGDPETSRMLDVLKTVGRVLDLRDEQEAEAELRALPGLAEH